MRLVAFNNDLSINDLFLNSLSHRDLTVYNSFLDVLRLKDLFLGDSYLHSLSFNFSFAIKAFLQTLALSSSLAAGPLLCLDYQSKCSFSIFIGTVVTTWFSNTNLLTLSNKKRKMNRIAKYWIQAILMSCQNPGRYLKNNVKVNSVCNWTTPDAKIFKHNSKKQLQHIS